MNTFHCIDKRYDRGCLSGKMWPSGFRYAHPPHIPLSPNLLTLAVENFTTLLMLDNGKNV